MEAIKSCENVLLDLLVWKDLVALEAYHKQTPSPKPNAENMAMDPMPSAFAGQNATLNPGSVGHPDAGLQVEDYRFSLHIQGNNT